MRENVCRCKESSGAYDLHFSVAPLFATHDDPCLILAVLLAFDDRSAAQFWKFKSISLILGKFVAVIRICFLRCRHSYLSSLACGLLSLWMALPGGTKEEDSSFALSIAVAHAHDYDYHEM